MPQMMPLPWLFVFCLIFLCFFTLTVYFSCFYKGVAIPMTGTLKVNFISMPW